MLGRAATLHAIEIGWRRDALVLFEKPAECVHALVEFLTSLAIGA
jgi:hypothetical protein